MSGFLASLDPRRVQWGAAWYAMHSRILRTKPVESMLEGTGATSAHGTKLAQVLTTVDLISLGVGSCVGTGMYVVSGLVAKEMAGPGVIVSFIIAAVASILSGTCAGKGFPVRLFTALVAPHPALVEYLLLVLFILCVVGAYTAACVWRPEDILCDSPLSRHHGSGEPMLTV